MKMTGAGLDVKGVRVAQAERVDKLIDAGRALADEWVVRGDDVPDYVIVAESSVAVHVDAEELSKQVAEGLSVGRVGVLAHPNIEHPILAEVDSAAIVIGSAAEIV
jgi:hypothetical protein